MLHSFPSISFLFILRIIVFRSLIHLPFNLSFYSYFRVISDPLMHLPIFFLFFLIYISIPTFTTLLLLVSSSPHSPVQIIHPFLFSRLFFLIPCGLNFLSSSCSHTCSWGYANHASHLLPLTSLLFLFFLLLSSFISVSSIPVFFEQQ